MLGIVLGFTLSAGAIIMGWGYIAESEMHSFQENCSAIPNAYVKTDGKEYVVDGVLSYYGACVCRVGYTYIMKHKKHVCRDGRIVLRTFSTLYN